MYILGSLLGSPLGHSCLKHNVTLQSFTLPKCSHNSITYASFLASHARRKCLRHATRGGSVFGICSFTVRLSRPSAYLIQLYVYRYIYIYMYIDTFSIPVVVVMLSVTIELNCFCLSLLSFFHSDIAMTVAPVAMTPTIIRHRRCRHEP